MKQFIINRGPDKDNLIRFEGKDYHYLVHVRRLAAGEFFPALLPDGTEALIHIISLEKNILTCECRKDACDLSLDHLPSGNHSLKSSLPHIILFQALPKGDKMDLIVRQAAECGTAEIVPFVSEFSVGSDAGRQKFSRWQRIIKEARQQSGSKTATALQPLLTINELFDYWQKINDTNTLGLLFHHLPSENYPFGGLEKECLHGYLNSNPKITVLVVGPEGGFSDREVSLFAGNGFKPLTIGNTVLRTETAALYFTAAVSTLLLERDSWELKKA